MPKVHPHACVDSRVRLAEDAEVGPQCVIEGDVEIGPGTRLMSHVCIQGPAVIGARNQIFPFVTLGLAPQDRRHADGNPSGGVRIGDDNVLREGVTVHRATGQRPTTLGHRNYLMANSHVAHDCTLGDDITLANGALLGGHVTIEDRVFIGGNAAVHQFCRVGRLAMISGIAGVGQDLPPFCTTYISRAVGSLNIIGLRRAGYRDHIRPLTRAFDLLYRSGHTNGHALDLMVAEVGDDPLCAEMIRFIRASKRGIVAYCPREEIEAERV